MQLFHRFKFNMKKILFLTIVAFALLIPVFYVNAEDGSNQKDSDNQQSSTTSTSDQNQGKQDFSGVYNKFEQDAKGFAEAKKEYDSDDNSNVPSIKDNYVQQSQKVLVSTINVIMQRNQQLKDEVDGNDGYYGNVGKDVSEMLDQDNKKLSQYVSEVNLASTTSTLSQAASEIKNFRLQQQSYLRKLIISAHINRYQDTVIKTAQNRSKIIGNEIGLVKGQGLDTSSLESSLSQANTNINQAVSSIGSANDVLNNQTIDSDGLTLIQDYLDGAEQSIKGAYQFFKQIAIDGNVLFLNKTSGENIVPFGNSTSTGTSTQ